MLPSWCPSVSTLRRTAPRQFRPHLDCLEERWTPAGFVSWDGGAGTNNWFDAANWSGDTLPGNGDTVDISEATRVVFNGAGKPDPMVDSISAYGTSLLQVTGGALTTLSYVNGLSGLQISPAATFTLGGAVADANSSDVFGDIVNHGTFNFRKPGNSSFLVADGQFVNNGTFTWTGGNNFATGGRFTNNGLFDWRSSSTGSLFPTDTLTNNGTFRWAGTGGIGFSLSSEPNVYGLVNTGTFVMLSDATVFADGGVQGVPYQVINSGLMVKAAGSPDGRSIFREITSFTNSGTVAINAGTLRVQTDITQTAGQVRLGTGPGGPFVTLELIEPGSDGPDDIHTLFLGGGTLVGSGQIVGDVVNTGGVVAPGFSPGIIQVIGNFTQDPGGTLNMQIASLGGPGSGHDQLQVVGDVVLDGTLNVETTSPFVPIAGDTFVLIINVPRPDPMNLPGAVTGTITGTFATINGRTITPFRSYFETYNPTDFRVTAQGEDPPPTPTPDPTPTPTPDPAPVQTVDPFFFIIFPELPESVSAALVRVRTASGIDFGLGAAVQGELPIIVQRTQRFDQIFNYGEAFRQNGNDGIGDITGVVFTDLDGDGARSDGEPYRPGQVVFLDVDGDGIRSEGEPFTVTDAAGVYRFRDLRPGRYPVRLELGPKSDQTLPKRPWDVTLTVTVREVDDVDFAVVDRRLKKPTRPIPAAPAARPTSPQPGDATEATSPGQFGVAALGLLGVAVRRRAGRPRRLPS
jgi:hypothetical protein